MARQEVLDLQPGGGVAARLRAEARGDLEAAVRDRVVAGAQPRPVAEALLPASLLERRWGGGGVVGDQEKPATATRGRLT